MSNEAVKRRMQQLRFRAWWHIGTSVIFTAGALYCALKRLVIPAIVLILIVGFWVWIIRRSVEELAQLRERDPGEQDEA